MSEFNNPSEFSTDENNLIKDARSLNDDLNRKLNDNLNEQVDSSIENFNENLNQKLNQKINENLNTNLSVNLNENLNENIDKKGLEDHSLNFLNINSNVINSTLKSTSQPNQDQTESNEMNPCSKQSDLDFDSKLDNLKLDDLEDNSVDNYLKSNLNSDFSKSTADAFTDKQLDPHTQSNDNQLNDNFSDQLDDNQVFSNDCVLLDGQIVLNDQAISNDQVLSNDQALSNNQVLSDRTDSQAKDVSSQQSTTKQSGNDSDSQQELIDKLKAELSRLKKHLIQIEEDYTSELVDVQQREQSLEQELTKARAEVEQLNHRLNNTGPLVAIRQQAEAALDERDRTLQKCSKLEDEVQRSQASLANLQLVIERMQKDHEQRLQTANKLYEQNLREERCRYSQLENETNKYQLKLKESNAALQAASRLSQQLHAKQETIDQLRAHLQRKEELVNRLHDEIDNLNASTQGKVDKQFIKNLVVGYFNAPSDKKQDVARLLARILDFNEIEMRKSGIQLTTASGSFEHGHRRQGSSSSTTSSTYALDESFAQSFVHFLEEESKVHKLPVAKKLALDLTKISTPESQIKTTNLISTTTSPISLASSFATSNQLNKNEHNLDTRSSLAGQTAEQEIKPMVIPSAILNAQFNKLSLNGNKFTQQSDKAVDLSQQQPQQVQQMQQTANSSNTDTVKPIVLNLNLTNDN